MPVQRPTYFLLQIFSCSSTSVTPFLSIFAFFVISCHLSDPSIPVRDNCCCDIILINHNCTSAVIYKYHPLDQLKRSRGCWPMWSNVQNCHFIISENLQSSIIVIISYQCHTMQCTDNILEKQCVGCFLCDDDADNKETLVFLCQMRDFPDAWVTQIGSSQ